MLFEDGRKNRVANVFHALTRRHIRHSLILVALLLTALLVWQQSAADSVSSGALRSWTTDDGLVGVDESGLEELKKSTSRLHIVIPVSNGDPRLCKSMLAQTILGYPRPNLVMWNQTFSDKRFLGAGSHLIKISSTLEWLADSKNYETDDDLVVMIDAYDVWFQLPPETLIARYHQMIAAEDKRIKERMGKAFELEKISSKVIFSASKRCGPNDIRSVACYAVPESPLPRDIFGKVTDTMQGPTRWAGLRQHHLVSGFIMGTARDMRDVFQRAHENMQQCLDGDMKESEFVRRFCHHGSDQSFFNEMYGQQEYHREVMRRHHRGSWDRFLDRFMPWRAGAPRWAHKIETLTIDDPLNPSFPHEMMEHPDYDANQSYEFGIMVDHFSEVSHQTSNALHDTAFVRHDKPLRPQTDKPAHGWNIICKPRAPMPADLYDGTGGLDLLAPGKGSSAWNQLPLYSEVCAGTVPVAVHHNWVNKEPINTLWPEMWWTGSGRALLDGRRRQAAGEEEKKRVGGADTDTGESLTWDELCPAEWDKEVFLQ